MANTDPIVPASTVNSPYWDDYDESNNYYRILFRPGYAVQARELTQLQTMLQKQVERLGQNIFTNGSLVLGGEVSYQGEKEQIQSINLSPTYAGSNTIAALFVGSTIVSTNTSTSNVVARAYVLASSELNANEPPTIIVKTLNSKSFYANDTITILNNANVAANLAVTNPTSNSSVASIDQGVFFINGFFVLVEPQTIILDKYDNTPTLQVGLNYGGTIIDENTDDSLLDPAQGASNYQAPGATRWQIDLSLVALPISANVSTSSFIQLLTVEDGILQTIVSGPGYNVILDTMAQRTYDQAGNFVVKPFLAQLLPQVQTTIDGTANISPNSIAVTGSNTHFQTDVSVNTLIYVNNQVALVNAIISNTSLTVANTFPAGAINAPIVIQNPNDFTVKLSPGRGYVSGYEYNPISPTFLTLQRARAYANQSSYQLNSPLGNFLYINNLKGLPDIGAQEVYDMHIVPSDQINLTTQVAYSNTVVGNCRVRAIEFASGISTNAVADLYQVFLFNVNMANSNATFSSVNALAQWTNTSNGYIKQMDVDLSSKDNGLLSGNTILGSAGFNILVYQFPQTTIVPSTITDVNYRYRVLAQGVNFSSGVGTLTVSSPYNFIGAGTLSDLQADENFIVTIVNNNGNITQVGANGSIMPFAAALGRSIAVSPSTTATLSSNAGVTFTANVIYSVGMSGTGPLARVKTLVSGNTSTVNVSGGVAVTANSTVYLASGQIQKNPVSSSLKVAGVPDSLFIADVINLDKVYDFVGLNITQANLSSALDITNRFQLDTGQRDNYYDFANLILKSGYSSPVGPLLIVVDYFTHSGTSGFLTIDSYPNVTTNSGYANVPAYTSATTGISYPLGDCVDWRPIRQNATTVFTLLNARIQEPNQEFLCNFSYYLSRIDKIVLTRNGTFKVLQGAPALSPYPPVESQTDMVLYTLSVPPYTFDPEDVTAAYNENKRYTMVDIGDLDTRITNLEYYTSLNMLEQSAQSLSITDVNGLNAFKNGIIVDNFTGHGVGDVSSYDYVCSMDFGNGVLHAAFLSNNLLFNPNLNNSTNYSDQGNQITLSWSQANYISQPQASDIVNANPFNYTQFGGTLMLIPDNDTWYSQQQAPQVVVNLNGQNDAWEAIGAALVAGGPANGFGTQYGDWQTVWSGVTGTSQSTATNIVQQGADTVRQSTTTDFNQITTQQQRTTTTTSLVPQTITASIGNMVIDASVIPYMRANYIICHSNNMKPSTVIFPFFDNQSVLGYWNNPTLIQLGVPWTGVWQSNSHQEIVTSTSGGSGLLMAQPWWASMSANTVYPFLTLIGVSGMINVGDTVRGSISGASGGVVAVLRLTDNVSSATANTVTLAGSALQTANAYVGHLITIPSGNGAGQVAAVTAYNATTRVATIAPNWNVIPDTSSVYSIGSPQTGPHGVLVGAISLPGNQFLCGQAPVLVTSEPTGVTVGASTYAQTNYFAQGILEIMQNTLVSTRVPTIVTTTGTQDQALQSNVVVGTSQTDTIIAVAAPSCFPEGTLVSTSYGIYMPIEHVHVGDKVLAFDENDQLQPTIVTKKLVHLVPAIHASLVKVEFESGKRITVTLNHPMWTKNGWVHMRDIKVGDSLINIDNGEEIVETISGPLPNEVTYNIEVERWHTYIADDIKVSNGCGCGGK